MKSSLHSLSLSPFLLFLLSHLLLPTPELDPILSHCSQGHILAGWLLETGLISMLLLPEQCISLLPATSQHGHPWHQASLGPMVIYLFNGKTFVFFFFRCSSFDKKGGVWLFFYNWCSLTTPYSTRGHIKVGDIYILYCSFQLKAKVSLRLTVSQSVSLGVEPHLGLMTRYLAVTI
jgi:hypothetical protein